MTKYEVTEWFEFDMVGPIETVRYRTNSDATNVQFWFDTNVPGIARKGWNRTRSETAAMSARNYLKSINQYRRIGK